MITFRCSGCGQRQGVPGKNLRLYRMRPGIYHVLEVQSTRGLLIFKGKGQAGEPHVTTTLHGKVKMIGTGTSKFLEFELNVAARETLDWLWGLKEKYGIYPPLSREECRLVARVLENKANLFETWRHDKEHAIQDKHGLFVVINSSSARN